MGNACFGKKIHNKGVVHPVVAVHRDKAVTIKVRLTKGQLKDLIEKVDTSNDDNSELGRLIVQECSKGKLRARIVPAVNGEKKNNHSYKFSKGLSLRPIQEDNEERYHDV